MTADLPTILAQADAHDRLCDIFPADVAWEMAEAGWDVTGWVRLPVADGTGVEG